MSLPDWREEPIAKKHDRASFDCGEMKWIVRKLEWFCGTRMHSTIAGLSSD